MTLYNVTDKPMAYKVISLTNLKSKLILVKLEYRITDTVTQYDLYEEVPTKHRNDHVNAELLLLAIFIYLFI